MARRSFRTIHNRLFLLFLFCMLGLLLMVSFIYYQRATEQTRDKMTEAAEKNISQTAGLFDLYLKGYDSVTKTLNSNNELMRLLQNGGTDDPVLSVNYERRITDILGSVFFSRDDIVGIHVMTYAGKVYSFERKMGAARQEFVQEDWYRILKETSGEMKWLGVFPHSLMSEGHMEPVFSFGRQLYELNTLKRVGIVLIETDAGPILEALSNAKLGAGSSVSIWGQDGRVIVSTGTDREHDEPLREAPEAPQKDGEVRIAHEKKSLVVAAKVKMTGWTIGLRAPKEEINLELRQTQQFLLTVVAALVIVSTLLATFVSRSFSNPFKRLIQQMKKVETGNFKGSVDVNSYEELNILVASFNRMVGRMDELVERIKLASTSEKNAQLQALQSQVNPHFLYNTLDMIYWMLDERENDRLGRVILALSQMFRYSSEWEEGAQSTLAAELEQMRHYLTIIEIRLSGRIRVEIAADPAWLEAPLPKMTLQPIIENAVKYGIEPLSGSGALRVYTRVAGPELQLVVEDSGAGMDETRLARLRASLQAEEDGERTAEAGRKGIGLQNVHRRIRLMFGEPYGLRIDSAEGSGTTVVVAIPRTWRSGTDSTEGAQSLRSEAASLAGKERDR